MPIFIYSIASLIFTFALIDKFKNILIKILPDIPNSRSDHKRPISRGGGIIIFFVFSIFSLSYGIKNTFFFLPLFLVSLLDDYYNLSNIKRIIFQLTTVLLVYFNSNSYQYLSNIENPIINIIYFLCVSIFGLSMINLCNFMDGIDGILSGNMILILIFCALRFDISIFILIGSLMGFLYWNWEPAKIFMGDAGSTFLGAYLTSIFFNLNNNSNFIALLLISFPILGDSIICLIIRFFNKKNIFVAHKDHLYQRLRKSGWSASKITLTYMLCTTINIIFYVLFGLVACFISSFLILIFGYLLHKKFASKLFVQ